MTPTHRLYLTAALCLLVNREPQQRPLFRAMVNGVQVNVFVVTDRGAPVTGLVANDFELLDNGAKRPVEMLPNDSPMDVTVVLQTNVIMAALFKDQIEHAWKALATDLRPQDRVRLLVCTDRVREVQPLGPPPVTLDPKLLLSAREGQVSVLTEGIFDALAQRTEPDRRAVVAAFIADEGSEVLRVSPLVGVAAGADAVLYVVALPPWAEMSADWFAGIGKIVASTGGELLLGLNSDRPNDWRGAYRFDRWHGAPAIDLGGAVPATFIATPEAVRLVLEDMRHGYVLSYIAPDGQPTGWHDVAIRVLRPGLEKAVVRARQRYFASH